MTLAELKAEIVKDPTTVATALAHVITLPEGIEVLNNFAKQEAPKVIAAAKPEILKEIEAKVVSIVGGKNEGETAEAYIERLAKDLKTAKANEGKGGDEVTKARVVALEKELEDFKKTDWEGKYNTLATQTATKIEGYETKLKDLETGNLTALVTTDLTAAYGKLTFNPNIPKSAIDALASQVNDKVMKTAKVVEGKTVYYNEDGTPMLNELFKPITAEEIYRKNMADLLTTTPGKGTPGGGAGKTTIVKDGEGDKATKKLVLDPAKFNTKLSFTEHAEEALLAEGVEKGSKDWNDLVMGARTEYGVDKMDRF